MSTRGGYRTCRQCSTAAYVLSELWKGRLAAVSGTIFATLRVESALVTTMNERNNVMPKKSMKELVNENGGYFACAFTTERGVRRSNVMVRASDVEEARSKLEKLLGCVLTAFCVQAYVC